MSHHREVDCTVRITNEGRILSYWFLNPITKKLVFVNTVEEE
jgi:hypothetical protein